MIEAEKPLADRLEEEAGTDSTISSAMYELISYAAHCLRQRDKYVEELVEGIYAAKAALGLPHYKAGKGGLLDYAIKKVDILIAKHGRK